MGVTRFRGSTVFVTGGAHGIGRATAEAFATEGANVFLYDRDAALLAEAEAAVAAAGAGSVAGQVGDVRSRAQLEAALARCEGRLGEVDVLVANAGYSRSRVTVALPAPEWDEIVGVCLTGVYRTAQTVARAMVRRGAGGVILTACATSAVASEPGQSSYAAAKAGVLALTRAMAIELWPHRIRVCSVLPGEVETYAWENVELQRLYEGRIAAGRSARPQEAAATYLYLASQDAAHLTGVAMVVDGGMLAWE